MKVKLKTDLTKYLTGLVTGTEGETIGKQGIWSRANDNFITVRFPMGSLDVKWDSLEIIDEQELQRIADYTQQEFLELKDAKNIELTLGCNGGFKYLHYEYGINNCGIGKGFKKEAERLLAIFKAHNKEIRTKYEF